MWRPWHPDRTPGQPDLPEEVFVQDKWERPALPDGGGGQLMRPSRHPPFPEAPCPSQGRLCLLCLGLWSRALGHILKHQPDVCNVTAPGGSQAGGTLDPPQQACGPTAKGLGRS